MYSHSKYIYYTKHNHSLCINSNEWRIELYSNEYKCQCNDDDHASNL